MDESFIERRRMGQLCSWEAVVAPLMGLFTEASLPAATTSLGLAAEEGAGLGTLGAIAPEAIGTGVSIGASPFMAALPGIANAFTAANAGTTLARNLTAPQAPVGMSVAPSSAPSAAPGDQSGLTPEEYKRNQNAYYQQMLAGLGMGQPGGQLPADIQQNIDRQASLLGG